MMQRVPSRELSVPLRRLSINAGAERRFLHRLIYVSEARPPSELFGRSELGFDGVFAKAELRNRLNGISGGLVIVKDHFIQVLEGEPDKIETIFESICRDMRHSRIKLVDYSEASERAFEKWGMTSISAKTAEERESHEDLFVAVLAGMAPNAIVAQMREFFF